MNVDSGENMGDPGILEVSSPLVSNIKWQKDDRDITQAVDGERVSLTADINNVVDGSSVKIKICKIEIIDPCGPYVDVQVSGGKLSGITWPAIWVENNLYKFEVWIPVVWSSNARQSYGVDTHNGQALAKHTEWQSNEIEVLPRENAQIVSINGVAPERVSPIAVSPGTSVEVEVTVRNTGQNTARFDVDAFVDRGNKGGWIIECLSGGENHRDGGARCDVQGTVDGIVANDTKTVRFRVTAPAASSTGSNANSAPLKFQLRPDTASTPIYHDPVVRFDRVIPQVRLTINANNGGRITAPSCSAGCTYNKGEIVNIKASPNDFYDFREWTTSRGSRPDDASNASTYVILNEDTTITANFQRRDPSASNVIWRRSSPNGGKITASVVGGSTVYATANVHNVTDRTRVTVRISEVARGVDRSDEIQETVSNGRVSYEWKTPVETSDKRYKFEIRINEKQIGEASDVLTVNPPPPPCGIESIGWNTREINHGGSASFTVTLNRINCAGYTFSYDLIYDRSRGSDSTVYSGSHRVTESGNTSSVRLSLVECKNVNRDDFCQYKIDAVGKSTQGRLRVRGNIIPKVTLRTKVNGSGSVSPSCSSGCERDEDSSVRITARPASGWRFVRWDYSGTEPDSFRANDSNDSITLRGDVTLTAVFEKEVRKVTLRTKVNGSGSVSPSCSSGCERDEDSSVRITARPASGWRFVRWDYSGTEPDSFRANDSDDSITLIGDVTLTAVFQREPTPTPPACEVKSVRWDTTRINHGDGASFTVTLNRSNCRGYRFNYILIFDASRGRDVHAYSSSHTVSGSGSTTRVTLSRIECDSRNTCYYKIDAGDESTSSSRRLAVNPR